MTERKGYVDTDYLRFVAPSVSHLKRRTYELLQLKTGSKVLDIGCGPGTDTIDIGRLVGPEGLVLGVDHDSEMVGEARARAQAAGVSVWVKHERAESTQAGIRVGKGMPLQ